MNRLPNDESSENRCKRAGHCAVTISAYGVVARAHRVAALGALTAQFAHRMRNPLAAIQAACANLRNEIRNPDHRERLDLILQEVARTFTLISADVQAFTQPEEPPCEFDTVSEIASVIEIIRAVGPITPEIDWQSQTAANCVVPRTAFRVAVYGLLEQLIEIPLAKKIRIKLHRVDKRLQIRFTAEIETVEYDAITEPSSFSSTESVDRLGLQIAERFARDNNGRLKRWMPENGSQVITLDLPCDHG